MASSGSPSAFGKTKTAFCIGDVVFPVFQLSGVFDFKPSISMSPARAAMAKTKSVNVALANRIMILRLCFVGGRVRR